MLVLDEADACRHGLPARLPRPPHLPARRQTLFFSETMPPPIVALARRSCATPSRSRSSAAGAGHRITHTAYLSRRAEVAAAPDLLAQPAPQRPGFRGPSTGLTGTDEFLAATGSVWSGSTAPQPDPATQALAGFKSGFYQGCGHGHRRARHRHRRPEPVGTSTSRRCRDYIHAWAGPRGGGSRRRAHARRAERGGTSAPSSGPPGPGSPGPRCRASTTATAVRAPGGLSPSASRRCGLSGPVSVAAR